MAVCRVLLFANLIRTLPSWSVTTQPSSAVCTGARNRNLDCMLRIGIVRRVSKFLSAVVQAVMITGPNVSAWIGSPRGA